MKRFLKVSATLCNENGEEIRGQFPKEMFISIDLIGAIYQDSIYPKNSRAFKIGGDFYKVKPLERFIPSDL